MNRLERSQKPPPSYEEVMAGKVSSNNSSQSASSNRVQSASSNVTVNLNYQTCKAILDGNYNKALKTIEDRIRQGEKISKCSVNLEGRALQGDWGMAKSLAQQRLDLGLT